MQENRRRYQSNEYTKDLGLNWMGFHARQYDPQIGRFLGVDPLADVNGQEIFNPYAAMGNAPESIVDPDGEVIVDIYGNPVIVSRNSENKLQYIYKETYSEKERTKAEKVFQKNTVPEQMNASSEGYKDIETLNSLVTKVNISHSKGKNANANSRVYPGNIINGYYDEVTISPFFGNHNNNKGDFAEWLGATMTVEVGHLEKQQIVLDQAAIKANPRFLNEPKSIEFINVYTPLMNRATILKLCIGMKRGCD